MRALVRIISACWSGGTCASAAGVRVRANRGNNRRREVRNIGGILLKPLVSGVGRRGIHTGSGTNGAARVGSEGVRNAAPV